MPTSHIMLFDPGPVTVPMDNNTITDEYYTRHFAGFLPNYIARGKPSPGTVRKYVSEINQFLAWCSASKREPLKLTDYQMRQYREFLFKRQYSPFYIAHMLISVRIFFMIACRLGLIKANPCLDVELPYTGRDDFSYQYFDMEQIKLLARTAEDGKSEFVIRRNKLILYLMAIEGLRNIELFRLNREDIDFEHRMITVHGKGNADRTEPVYPCDETMQVLQSYLAVLPPVEEIKHDNLFTPLLLSDSNRKKYARLAQTGIRNITNKLLKEAGLKYKGYACHILRHSCGTNLYQATKDLRVVQETLRQKNPVTTAKYAHVQQKLATRPTSLLFKEQAGGQQPTTEVAGLRATAGPLLTSLSLN